MSAIKKFGLIGHPLGHSLSPYIHERIMEKAGIRGTYTLYDLNERELEKELPALLSELDGFNCTIPYKSAVIPFLRDLDEPARRYGAVNTVCQGKGYNTDRAGFLAAAPDMRKKKVLITGAGGVSRMMAYEAISQKADITICARNKDKRDILIRELTGKAARQGIGSKIKEDNSSAEKNMRVTGISDLSQIERPDFDVLLNGTPLGMWPKTKGAPTADYIFRKGQQLFDTIYNPAATRWMMRAGNRGVQVESGLSMLLMQAVHAQMIWNPDTNIDLKDMMNILPELSGKLPSLFPVKYIITGYMGAGKSSLAKNLSQNLNIPALDLDDEIVSRRGCSISEIFGRDGETAFRNLEVEVLEQLLQMPGSAILSLGGGAIINERIRDLIARYPALTIYIDVPFPVIWKRVENSDSRPLLGTVGHEEAERFTKAAILYEDRLPVYHESCDGIVNGNQDQEQVVKETLLLLGYE